MIRIHEIKLRAGKPESRLVAAAERRLGLERGSIAAVKIAKESLDAREKPDIFRVFSLDLVTELTDEELLAAAERNKVKAGVANEEPYILKPAERSFEERPVVCGFGPCGIFAALALSMYGARPIVLERGASMERRIEAVERFFAEGKLDPAANVQFGEGGAGTFSDGKLTTGTKDPAHRFIMECFVEAGASPDILYKSKPHIGTDVLRRVVVGLRKKIEDLGGELRFGCEMKSLDIEEGRVKGLWLADGEYIKTDTVILALGHSARNTVRTLYGQGLKMEQKPFSMGVRIEHPQSLIDLSQYGCERDELALPPADYKLAVRTAEGRGVYTFCMCPGGYVVAAASEEGGLVTNGMSNSTRAAENANSALLADVRISDMPSDHPLAGLELQEKYERLAFKLGGSAYKAPCETVGDFLEGRRAEDQKGFTGLEPVLPSYRPGVVKADLRECLPAFVCDALAEALPLLDKKLRGFASPDAVMTAPETRSSAPYRIKRDACGRALASDGSVIEGLYPSGEGAGYAGGIMSAASDGLHQAERSAMKR
ncbi:MAG: hypothetical protein IJM17_09990 [Firmicutes bacterium]|nr:hypothetical protein [Bacillota bacterium]